MKLSPTIVIRRVIPHAAAVAALLACAQLALWQLDRAGQKQHMQEQWETAATAPLGDVDRMDLFAQVSGTGRFDTDRHVLLDNQMRNNYPGVHVFTPFRLQGSEQIIMVNRGWQPWDRRSPEKLQLETPSDLVTIAGRVSDPPRVGLQIGDAAALDPQRWPNLMTYFDSDRIRDALGPEVGDRVLLLEPADPMHLTGDPWRLMNMGPERHIGYAFQWASIGLAILLIWLILTFRSLRQQ